MPSKKASAPRPVPGGRQAQAEAIDAAKQVFRFTIRDHEYRIALDNIPLNEKLTARQSTGLPWHTIRGEDGTPVDIGIVAIWAWLARRASGEPLLTWPRFEAEWDPGLSIADVSDSAWVPVDESGETDPQL